MNRRLSFLLAASVLATPALASAIDEHDPLSQSRELPSQVNVRDFGAIPNDGKSDTHSLRQALEAVPLRGGKLIIGGGDYLLDDSLRIDRGNLIIECESARLVVDGPAVKLLEFRGNKAPGGRISDIRIVGCGFYDPSPRQHAANEESHGIVLNYVDGATLRELRFDSLGDESIDIIFSTDVRVLDSYAVNGCAAVTHPYVGTFSINNSSRVQLRGNTFERNANGSAIRVEVTRQGYRADHLVIADNLIFGPVDGDSLGSPGGTGIAVIPAQGDARAVVLSGNQILNPFRSGIFVAPALNATVTSLLVWGNLVSGGGSGAAIGPDVFRGAINIGPGVSRGVVQGNVVEQWGVNADSHAGIRISDEGFAISGNVISGVPGFGVLINKEGNTVVGNLISDAHGVSGQTRDLGD